MHECMSQPPLTLTLGCGWRSRHPRVTLHTRALGLALRLALGQRLSRKLQLQMDDYGSEVRSRYGYVFAYHGMLGIKFVYCDNLEERGD